MTTTLYSTGSTTSVTTGGRPGGAGILQTQLSRYQTQLADWCNCPGGKTAEGKKIITDLQQKADAVKMQLKQIDDARARAAEPAQPAAGTTQQPPDRLAARPRTGLDVYA